MSQKELYLFVKENSRDILTYVNEVSVKGMKDSGAQITDEIWNELTKEESALADCKAAVGDAADRFILSKCQFFRRIQGERKMIEKVAFSGYFFIERDVPEMLEKLLMRILGVVTPVRIGGGFHPIRQEEETMLKQMMDENDCILYSVGNIVDGKLIVEEGPLKRFTGKVIKIERHDRWADIEMPLFEKCKTMKVGLEIKAKVTAEEYRAMKKAV